MPDPTLEALKSGMAIVGIEAACIKPANKYYLIKTASEASIKGTVDSGENKPLRKGNRLLARHKTEDLITGYEIRLSDLLVYPEVVALIDGGVVTNSEEGAFESYAGPVTGEEVVRTVFALELYCANKDTGNNIVNYQKLTFTGCRGKSVVEWDIKEGEFFAPKYTIESMPAVGESPMTMEVVDALPVLEQVMRMMSLVAQEKGTELTYRAEGTCTMLATRDEIHQIIYNLTDNAVKYTPPGSTVQVSLFREGDQVVLTVEDNGAGIPEEDLPRIFERFYRVDKARSRAAGGTGLGLAIVRDTVEKRGGTVEAANRPGGGAVFTVRWPWREGGGQT